MLYLFYMVITGFLAGILSGMFGIGGGVVIVPILVLLLGLEQKSAESLSMNVSVVGGRIMSY